MKELLPSTRVPSVLEAIRASLEASDAVSGRHDFWVFAGPSRRRQVRQALVQYGYDVTLHAAYKPLVSELITRRNNARLTGDSAVDAASGTSLAASDAVLEVHVACPAHPEAQARRFELEAYPLVRLAAKWWPGATVRLESLPATADLRQLTYQVRLTTPDQVEEFSVFAPNRLSGVGVGASLTPCGWWRSAPAPEPPRDSQAQDGPWLTPYERLYRLAMDTVLAQPWNGTGPFFGRLDIEVTHDGTAERLPTGHDRLDTAEALHEDLYFSVLEEFGARAGLPWGSREQRLGQVVPTVLQAADHSGAGGPVRPNTVRVRVLTLAETAAGPGPRKGRPLSPRALAELGEAPDQADVMATVDALPGKKVEAQTPQGRRAVGLWRPGSARPVLINGGQHANENSGVVGALRAAAELLADPWSSVGLVALENPDGYALHRELCSHAPEHMHHAARYSSLGDDVEYRTGEPHESAVRRELLALSGAELLINLHGYPAHEWVRPLTGYLPRNFEWWAMPQGFILMARHQPGHGEVAEKLLRHVARELQRQVPALADYNRGLLEAYEVHAGKLLFPQEGWAPLAISEAKRPGPLVHMITEYPDETVYGDDLRLAHEVQYRAAILASRYWDEVG